MILFGGLGHVLCLFVGFFVVVFCFNWIFLYHETEMQTLKEKERFSFFQPSTSHVGWYGVKHVSRGYSVSQELQRP